MFRINMLLPHGGKRELALPIVPRVGEFIWFEDSEGLGDISNGKVRRLRVVSVSLSAREVKFNDEWEVSIDTSFDELD